MSCRWNDKSCNQLQNYFRFYFDYWLQQKAFNKVFKTTVDWPKVPLEFPTQLHVVNTILLQSYLLKLRIECAQHNEKKNIYIYIYIFKWSKELHDADDVSFLFFLIVQFTSCSDLFCCYFRSLVIDKGQKIRNWTDLNHSNIWIHSMFSWVDYNCNRSYGKKFLMFQAQSESIKQ